MSRSRAVAAISMLAPEQWGMVTAAQARALSVSRVDLNRLVLDGVLERVASAARVYRLAGSPPDPDLDPLRAAWLQLGGDVPASARLREPDAIVSHRSAAAVLGLGDLVIDVHEFYVFRRHQVRRADLRLRVRDQVPHEEWRIVQGLPACTAGRVVADLLAEREDESAVARICRDAIRRNQLTRSSLAVLAAPHAAAYGHRSVETMVSVLAGAGTSEE